MGAILQHLRYHLIRVVQPQRISASNSSAVALEGNATFTGAWEDVSEYNSVIVSGVSDKAGTLWVDFSPDGSNADRQVQLSSGASGVFGIHHLAVVARFARVRLVNGSQSQVYMRLQTMYGSGERRITSRAKQTVNDYSDVLNVRVLTDPILDEATGRQSDRTTVDVFGRNSAVAAATVEDVWSYGGIYTGWLTAAATVRIAAGGNANDTAAGTGARSITIVGLDQNWAAASETVATNGALASAATTTTFIRVYRAYVETTGTYTGNNTGAVVIETGAGTVMANIAAGYGQTQMAIYTVPAGKTAYVRRVSASTDGTKATDIEFWYRSNADDVSAPYSGVKRLWHAFAQLSGTGSDNFGAPEGPFPAKTDLWVSATGPSGGTGVSAEFDLVLVTA